MHRLRLAAAVAASLAAFPAFSQSADYAGVWRIMKADPAPWAQQAQPAPGLLRAGIAIGDGKFRAPAALACAAPQFSESSLQRDEAFGGAGAKAVEKIFEQYGLSTNGVPNLRVTCGARHYDFHFNARQELVALHEGSILTLRKHGEEIKAAEEALAPLQPGFDCSRAKTVKERIVCEWPDALLADSRMNADFRRLQKALGKTNAAALLQSQRTFNSFVAAICKTGGKMPDDASQERDMAGCIAGYTLTRADFLAGLDVYAAGSMRIEPAIVTRTKVTGKGDDISGWMTNDALPVMSGASRKIAEAFAQQIRKLFRANEPLLRGRDTLTGAITRTYRIATMNENFISLVSTEHVEAGTSVPDYTFGLNFDLKSGKPLPLSAIFDRSENWKSAVVAAIRKDLNEPDRFDEYREQILAGADNIVWLFGKDRVTVIWRPGGIGPGEYAEIPASTLAPFVKDSSPWRP